MDSQDLIRQIQDSLRKVAELRGERQAIGSSVVKAWKTEVETLLRLGGKNTSKLLSNFQKMKFGAGAIGKDDAGLPDVKFQAFQAELDSAEKLLKSAIQTIQIFGVTEEQKLPDWFKREAKASGLIRIGEREVDVRTVTLLEFLNSILAMADSDRSLDESLKREVQQHIEALKKQALLQPFLNQTIDKAFSHL